MRTLLIAFALLMTVPGCDGIPIVLRFDAPAATGLVVAESERSAADTFSRLEQALEENDAISIVARVDHAANAANAGMTLRPTRLILFGNPRLGTPLMQAAQTTGIDLPQKMLVWEGAGGRVFVAYNGTDYLVQRHGLEGMREVTDKIAGALETLAEQAAGDTLAVRAPRAVDVQERAGLVVRPSSFGVAETYDRLKGAIEEKAALTILAELDHAANAARVGMTLRPTRLILFGNPRLGTPLMQAAQTIAIDLPQKMLVWEDAAGQVFVAYNDPFYLAARHGITAQDAVLQQIADALAGLATAATRAN